MSELKRRDLINYFNDRHLAIQKNQYDFNMLTGELRNKMINYLTNTRDISHKGLNTKILNTSSDMFGVGTHYITYRASFYDSIDLVFKAFLELYENVMVTDNASDFYQKYILTNKGKYIKTYVDFKESDVADNLISYTRNKNIKILIVSTQGLKDIVTIETLQRILFESNCLVMIDDFHNNIKNEDLMTLVSVHSNVIILKSIYERNKHDVLTSFVFSNEENINILNSFVNYLDIDIFNLISIYLNLDDNENTSAEPVLDSPVETRTETIVEEQPPKEEKYVNHAKDLLNEKLNSKVQIQDEVSKIVNDSLNEKAVDDKNAELKFLEDIKLDNTSILLEKEGVYNAPIINKTSNETNKEIMDKVEAYTPNLLPGSRYSLIGELTKYNFISIFSSNSTHVYILSKTPIHHNLTESGLVLKKYNSSNGEIIRLTIDNNSQNIRVLKVIYEISLKRLLIV